MTLRLALLEQYRSLETDSELSRRLSDRHQQPLESFDDFYTAIQQLNSRLRVPKQDQEIIELLKQNVRRRMGELLITFQTNSLPEMVYVCRNIEKYLNSHEPQRGRNAFIPPPRRNVVSELRTEDSSLGESSFPNVEAFQQKRDTRRFTCWNCKKVGHSFFECSDPQRNLFCYKCGQEDTTTPQCLRCSGNDPRSSLVSRGNCSRNQNPDAE